MMLELHGVTIGSLVRGLSLTLGDGEQACLLGAKGSGKTTLLRAVLGFLPIDGGHISIDGELLTPLSAPYFRRMTAYVPQHLSLPDGTTGIPTDYRSLLERAVRSDKQLLFIDEPEAPLSEADRQAVDGLLQEAAQRGATVLAVNAEIYKNRISL